MADTNQVEVEFIAFHTRDDISARNVVRLISSVELLYVVFYSKVVAERQHDDAIHALMRSVDELDHPMWHEFGMVWREYLHFMRKCAYKGAPFLLPPYPGMPDIGIQLTSPSQILQSLDAYRDRSDHLIIDRIRISSPGGFSFKGSGEVIAQLREFIKDVWYRNNQELVRGETPLSSHFHNPPQYIRNPTRLSLRRKKEKKEGTDTDVFYDLKGEESRIDGVPKARNQLSGSTPPEGRTIKY